MTILVLNGSPRGEKSNTLKITRAFLAGMNEASSNRIEELTVADKNIGHCRGCFACWKTQKGTCVIDDDMGGILDAILRADLVIWSFPLYYFSLPSKLKALMDRMLPLNQPFMDARADGGATHPPRYDLSHQKHMIISTCGFYSTENNYEAIRAQFNIAFGTSAVTPILCAEGELMSIPELRERVGAYLSLVRRAGREFGRDGNIPAATANELSQLLLPAETYAKLADANWGIERQEIRKVNTDGGTNGVRGEGDASANGQRAASASFIDQMAALYNPLPLGGSEAMLVMAFTDTNREYRLLLGKKDCRVLGADEPSPDLPLTRIETPFSVWTDIARGERDGSRALMEGAYRVTGNFDLMLNMDTLFGGPAESNAATPAREEASRDDRKKPNMALVILPWMPLWIALPILGPAALPFLLAALVLFQLAGLRWKTGNHERIALALTGTALVALLAGAPLALVIQFSYAAFGLHWLLSCLTAVPLTAWYSKEGYGGDAALQNALFINTNAIITAVWGLLYIATALWTPFVYASPAGAFTGAINSLTAAVCGIWTVWFQKWYPARVARG